MGDRKESSNQGGVLRKNLPETEEPFCRGGEASSCQALAPPLYTVTQGQEEVSKQSPSGQPAPGGEKGGVLGEGDAYPLDLLLLRGF
jgi:hypothetical protein